MSNSCGSGRFQDQVVRNCDSDEVSESEELEVYEDYDDDDGHVENGVTADGDDDTVDVEHAPSESDGDMSDRHEVFFL